MISSFAENNWLTIVVITMMFILVLMKFLFEKQFLKFVAFTNPNEYLIDYVNKVPVISVFNALLLVFQVSSFSLLIVKMNKFMFFYEQTNLLIFIQAFFLILSFFLIRYFVGKLIAFPLKLTKDQDLLTFIKFTYLSKIALIIFPFLIVNYYINGLDIVFSQIILVFTILLLGIKYVKIGQKNQKIIFNNLFYFILYLCTLEIAPLFFVYKLLIYKE